MAIGLKEFINVWENQKERAGIITEFEHEGDAITHDIMTLLNTSFIPPFDREDIVSLAFAMDEVADRIEETSDSMILFGVKSPTDKAKEMADITLQAVTEVEKGIAEISGHIDRQKLLKRCVEINRLENLGDSVFRSSLVDLFAKPADAFDIVKWRALYDEMESVIDGCEAIADILENIAFKYA